MGMRVGRLGQWQWITTTLFFLILGLAERLVGEVRKLQQELFVYRAKLSTATEIIEKMPSEGETIILFLFLGMSVQFNLSTPPRPKHT